MEYREGDIVSHPDGRRLMLQGNEWVEYIENDSGEGLVLKGGEAWVPPTKSKKFDMSPEGIVNWVVDAASNVPGSAGNMIMDSVYTVAGLPSAAVGAVTDPEGTREAVEAFPGRIAEHYRGRYGTAQDMADTFRTDPVGAVADIPVVGGPVMGGAKAASLTGKAMPQSLNRKLYAGNAKFGGAKMRPGKDPRAQKKEWIDTALYYGLTPDDKGLDKLVSIQNGVEAKLDMLVEAARKKGTIPASRVVDALDDVAKEVGPPNFGGGAARDSVIRSKQQWNDELQAAGITEFTVDDLQRIKKNAQAGVTNWHRRPVESPVSELENKAVARRAREEVEGLVPEIAGVNREWGRLEDLKQPMTAAANRIENRQAVGATSIGGGIMGSAATGDVGGTLLGMVLGSVVRPETTTRAALWSAKQKRKTLAQIMTQNPGLSTAEYMALLNERMEEDDGR